MEHATVGLVGLVLLLVFLVLGMPISIIFLFLYICGLAIILDFEKVFGLLGQGLYFNTSGPNWAALPLFILLGFLATQGGYAQRAFKGLNVVTKGLPGALAIATCFSCAFFGAMSGSSAATAAIFAKLTLPEMWRYGYNKKFAAGVVACAGTFAAMIPPSGLMVVYALLTKQSIGKMFAGGIVPGIITAVVYAALILVKVKYNPSLIGTADDSRFSFRDRLAGILDVWPALLVATVILGGIYSGLFTPTEAAATGCLSVLIMGYFHGGLRSLKAIRSSMRDSATTASMIFFIIICAIFFSRFLAFTQIPIELANWIAEIKLQRFWLLIGILAVWFLLGMVMIPDGIYVLTTPIFFPLIAQAGYDPIWFGIITIKLSEIANVTPPVGLNIFALQGAMEKQITAEEIYAGIWPFVACEIGVLSLMILFPEIVIWLPTKLLGP